MSMWRPRIARLDQVKISRDAEDGLLPVIHVDDQEFSWEEFGKMLCTYAGWGMRIVFVPDDELEHSPKIVIQEPDV